MVGVLSPSKKQIWFILTAMVTLILLIFIAPTMSLASSKLTSHCQLPGQSKVIPKYLYIKDKEHPIVLLTTRRIPQQLLTTVVGIFLQRHLGYMNVVLKYEDGFLPDQVVNAMGIENKYYSISDDFTPPKAVATLEMWTPPEYNPTEYYPLTVNSYLGVVGRLGWFFPYYALQKYNVMDHWRTFTRKDSPAIKVFHRTAKELSALEMLLTDANGTFICGAADGCDRGIFTPVQCKSEKCAVLFSGSFEDSKFLMEHVTSMRMYVRIAWIGSNLDQSFLKYNFYYPGDRSVLFFHYTPDVLIQPFNLTSVTFPSCADHIVYPGINKSVFCKYEMHRFHKVIWIGLKNSDIYLMRSLERVTMTAENYDDLISEYNRDPSRSLHDIACSWMKVNVRTWSIWRNGNTKPSLYFVGLFPVNASSPDKQTFVDPGNVPAFKMAIEAINKNVSILPNHLLRHIVVNTACEPDIVMLEFIKIIQHSTRNGKYSKIVGMVGPACSDTVEPLAGVSKYFKMPVISYGAEGAIFSDRDQYPYFFRTIPENKNYRHVYLQLFKRFGWNRVASLTEDGHQYSEYLTPLQDLLQENGIVLNMRKYPQSRKSINMTQYLRDLKKKNYRIIIGDFYQDVARYVLCGAYHLKMTGQQGYVWFVPRWYSNNWFDVDASNVNNSLPVPCTTDQMLEAIQGHMSLSHKYFADDYDITPENSTVKEWRQNYENLTSMMGIKQSDYAGFTYDAVWTYALALNKLFKEDHSYTSNLRSDNTTIRFMHYINSTDFEGVSGSINFKTGPSRRTDILLWQFTGDEYVQVGRFYHEERECGRLELKGKDIVWPAKSLPKDGSKECIVEALRALLGEEVTCNTAIVVLCTTSFVLLGIILIGIILFLKRRYETKLRLMEEMWKDQSIFQKFKGWEIPRSKVVINRKLGEGQFGTVYGGECLIEPSGWRAVAVKTLKVGSSITEKLDFLSEAEMMKNFDHENIVKLIGVCTESEPIYTIMEFMLYGDLKTYLLARRNLVNENTSRGDDDEVGNARLTSMALDVAKALAYIGEFKFVHRDVACRNCLVNAQRSVKLADFGMTRPLNEKNYYRFSRKGMLPVRWMAPESLVDGVFTPASDVWSYGVLLYEIITFGAFPFQGLSNNQVFERVKEGHTLPIPSGIAQQLECLLQACWHPVPAKRITASQIAIHLENSARLISPSLEAPQMSVALEDSADLEMHQVMQDKARKLSLSLNSRAFNAQGMTMEAPVNNSNVANARKRSMSGNMLLAAPVSNHTLTNDVHFSSDIEALNLNQIMIDELSGKDPGSDPLLPHSQYISTRFMSLNQKEIDCSDLKNNRLGISKEQLWANIPV